MHVFMLTARAEASVDDEGFDVELGSGTVISNDEDYNNPVKHVTYMFPEHRHNKKYEIGKHISFKTILPSSEWPTTTYEYITVDKPTIIPEEYSYLFFKEINPPPPKDTRAC